MTTAKTNGAQSELNEYNNRTSLPNTGVNAFRITSIKTCSGDIGGS